MRPWKRSSPKSKSQLELGFGLDVKQAPGDYVNGLRTIPEIPSITVDENNIASFSMPQEALDFTPDKNAVVTRFKNGQQERKLYCNTELTEEEQQNLQLLRQEAQSQNLAFMPSVASSALRYSTRAKGDVKSALKEMLGTQQWRQSYFKSGPITDASIAEDMKLGIVYFGGRDAQLRPSLVMRASRLPASFTRDDGPARLVKLLVFCLEYMLRYLVYPGKIETSAVILDLRGVSTTQIPVTPLREVVKVLSAHYIYRVHKFYLCNVPSMVRRMSGIGTRFLSERQLQKVNFVNSEEEIRCDFASHQLEQDLGGGRPPVTEFFPFPLQAGPFDASATAGVNRSAIPNVHLAFTGSGMQGRAWNPGQSRDDNVALEFTELAQDIFKQCGLPVPSGCPRRGVKQSQTLTEDGVQSESTCVNEHSDVSSSACDASRKAHEAPGPGSKMSDLVEAAHAEGSELTKLESVAPKTRQDPIVIDGDDGEVRPRSIFSCIPQCGTSCK